MQRDYLTGSTEHAQGSTVYGVLTLVCTVPVGSQSPEGRRRERGIDSTWKNGRMEGVSSRLPLYCLLGEREILHPAYCRVQKTTQGMLRLSYSVRNRIRYTSCWEAKNVIAPCILLLYPIPAPMAARYLRNTVPKI